MTRNGRRRLTAGLSTAMVDASFWKQVEAHGELRRWKTNGEAEIELAAWEKSKQLRLPE